MDDKNMGVRFCEEPRPTDTWLKYCGTAGKPGGKRRKQTSGLREEGTKLGLGFIFMVLILLGFLFFLGIEKEKNNSQ
jgi:hypothetical protein